MGIGNTVTLSAVSIVAFSNRHYNFMLIPKPEMSSITYKYNFLNKIKAELECLTIYATIFSGTNVNTRVRNLIN